MSEDSHSGRPSRLSRVMPWLMGVGILVLGVLGAMGLAALRQEAKPEAPSNEGPLVEVIEVHNRDVPVVVTGHGTVRAKTRAQLVPQVTGRVEYVAPTLTPGGFFKAGETLVRIDATDYRLALARARSRMSEADAAIAVAEAQVAERQAAIDNAKLDADRTRELFEADAASQRELDRIEATLRQAEAMLKSAQASLVSANAARESAEVAVDEAQTNLQRVEINMPFDGRVLSESVDPGQNVGPNNVLAEVYGTEAVEVVVPLEDRKLQWLSVPLTPRQAQQMTMAECSPADVTTEFAGRSVTWRGCAVRVEGELDPLSRVIRLVVLIPNPYDAGDNKPPLMPGTFVNVSLQGQTIHNAVAVPRHAVHQGDVVWVAHGDRLTKQDVEIIRRDRAFAYVTQGLADGDFVVTSQLDTVVDGMRIRTSNGDATGTTDSTTAAAVSDASAAAGVTPSTATEAPATADPAGGER